MKIETWVILEITPRGELEAKQGTLSLRLSEEVGIPIEDIYVPTVSIGGEINLILEGYIFIRSGYSTHTYLELVSTPYVESLISQLDPETNLISQGVLADEDLQDMIGKANQLGVSYEVGSRVRIKSGHFTSLTGVVVDVIQGEMPIIKRKKIKEGSAYYSVLIELRSAEVVVLLDSYSIESEL